jgi:hypothetical protein
VVTTFVSPAVFEEVQVIFDPPVLKDAPQKIVGRDPVRVQAAYEIEKSPPVAPCTEKNRLGSMKSTLQFSWSAIPPVTSLLARGASDEFWACQFNCPV